MAGTRVPSSRLGRIARFAALGTRVGTGRLAALLGRDDAERGVADAAAHALGTMRGIALKLGQMASYVDGAVPEEHRDTYERAMRSLRDAAPTMSQEAAERVVKEELGKPPDELFASWSPSPFASASIGQVHAARTHDGREVAVKVQYEGVDRAVASDLANASMMTRFLGPIVQKFGAKEQLEEARARFLEELDYAHEAKRQAEFGAIFAGDERVLIPEVIADRCARRVLTTELVRGLGFDEACGAEEDARRAWAETMWRFVFTGLLGHGLFNADPHPGNYFFVPPGEGPGGALWFLDFGCTRAVSRRQTELVRDGHRAAIAGDGPGLAKAFLENFQIRPGTIGGDFAAAYVTQAFAPILHKGRYKITREFARGLMDKLREGMVLMHKGPADQFSPMPPEWLFFNRLQLGFYSVLARMDVAVDYNATDAAVLSATA